MRINFYIFCCIAFIISYILIAFQQQDSSYLKNITKKFSNIKLKDEGDQKIKILYNILLIFITFFITIILSIQRYTFNNMSLYHKYFFYNIIYHNNETIYRISIAILFFLIGLLTSFGKKLIKSFINNFINYYKTLIITGNYIVLLYLSHYISTKFIILIVIIHLIFIINYFMTFQKLKSKMSGKEFILNFIWLLWICFSNSFILIYQIINKSW